MSKRILINASASGEVWAVFVENGTLEELFVESNRKSILRGNIYCAYVESIDTKLQAAFINYGTDRHGFISVRDILPSCYHRASSVEGIPAIQDVLSVGKPLLVQIKKEENVNKGAAFTTDITLASAYTVISPVRGGEVTLSRKMSNAKAKRQLKATIKKADADEQYGVMVRTAAEDQKAEEVLADFQNQVRSWGHLQAEFHQQQQAGLLYQESSLTKRMIRDHFTSEVDEIWVDEIESYQQLKKYCKDKLPLAAQRLHHYTNSVPLFVQYQIEEQIHDLTAHTIALPSGGNISINHTEALTVVDINSSRQSGGGDQQQMFLNTNCEAAVLIARQIRLRGIGGLVVIDFINMREIKHRKQVEKVFKEAIKKDRAHLEIGHLSRFCILELSRNRIQERSLSTTHTTCPTCEGAGFVPSSNIVAFKLINLLYSHASKMKAGQTIKGKLPVNHAMYLLNEKRQILWEIEQQYQIRIEIEADLHQILLPADPFASHSSTQNKASSGTGSESHHATKNRRAKRQNKNTRKPKIRGHKQDRASMQSKTRLANPQQGTHQTQHQADEPFTPPQIVGFISEDQLKRADSVYVAEGDEATKSTTAFSTEHVEADRAKKITKNKKGREKGREKTNEMTSVKSSQISDHEKRKPRRKPKGALSHASSSQVEAKRLPQVEPQESKQISKQTSKKSSQHTSKSGELTQLQAGKPKPKRNPRKRNKVPPKINTHTTEESTTLRSPKTTHLSTHNVESNPRSSERVKSSHTMAKGTFQSDDENLNSDLNRIRQKMKKILQKEPTDEITRERAEARARNRAKRISGSKSSGSKGLKDRGDQKLTHTSQDKLDDTHVHLSHATSASLNQHVVDSSDDSTSDKVSKKTNNKTSTKARNTTSKKSKSNTSTKPRTTRKRTVKSREDSDGEIKQDSAPKRSIRAKSRSHSTETLADAPAEEGKKVTKKVKRSPKKSSTDETAPAVKRKRRSKVNHLLDKLDEI